MTIVYFSIPQRKYMEEGWDEVLVNLLFTRNCGRTGLRYIRIVLSKPPQKSRLLLTTRDTRTGTGFRTWKILRLPLLKMVRQSVRFPPPLRRTSLFLRIR